MIRSKVALSLIGPTLVLTSACEREPSASDEPPPLVQAELETGYPQLDAACRGPVAEPTHLVVTSTDFNTGAVGLVELATREVHPDLALASSDAVPFVHDTANPRVFIVNRFGFDYIDELDPREALALVHEFAITPASTAAAANPQAIAIDPAGRGWVSLFGVGELQQFRFPTLAAARPSASLALDLRDFADDDGIPELGKVIGCGDHLFVSAERIDRSSWTPADETLLIPVLGGGNPRLFEFDGDHPGADAIALRGVGIGAWRLAPDDPDGHTILVLNSGLERVDLATGISEWVVDEQTFIDWGYERLQLADFDLDPDARIWISAATEDFSSYQLLRLDLSGTEPQLVTEFEGLQSVTGALEIVGYEAWFADTTIGSSGLRVFDLGQGEVVEFLLSPLPIGLPPMSLAPLSL